MKKFSCEVCGGVRTSEGWLQPDRLALHLDWLTRKERKAFEKRLRSALEELGNLKASYSTAMRAIVDSIRPLEFTAASGGTHVTLIPFQLNLMGATALEVKRALATVPPGRTMLIAYGESGVLHQVYASRTQLGASTGLSRTKAVAHHRPRRIPGHYSSMRALFPHRVEKWGFVGRTQKGFRNFKWSKVRHYRILERKEKFSPPLQLELSVVRCIHGELAK